MYDMLISSIKASEVVDFNGYPYFIHPLNNGIPRMDPVILREVITWIEDTANLNCDVIIAPESMGIPYAVPVSLDTGIPYSLILKKKFGLPGETALGQRTGYSTSTMYINGVHKGDRVVVVDDIVSTGGTLISILKTLRDKIGAKIVDVIVPIDKNGGAKIVERETNIKVKTLIEITVNMGEEVHCVLSQTAH